MFTVKDYLLDVFTNKSSTHDEEDGCGSMLCSSFAVPYAKNAMDLLGMVFKVS